MREQVVGLMIREPLFVEQTRWTTQNAMNMTTTRTEIKKMSLFENKWNDSWFGFSSDAITGNRIIVGRYHWYQEVNLPLVQTEVFTVNLSRLYQLNKVTSPSTWALSNVHFVLIRDDGVLEPPEHNSLSSMFPLKNFITKGPFYPWTRAGWPTGSVFSSRWKYSYLVRKA